MSEMIDELLADANERMQKSVESMRNELATVRTGRASPHLLDRLNIDYYGAADSAEAARPGGGDRRPDAHGHPL